MVGYAELHCHTNFSFLDGASHPEELAEEAHRLGLAGLAVTDHDGFYGVVRFAVAAQEVGLPTVFGAELTLGIDRPPNGTERRAGADGTRRAPRGASATSGMAEIAGEHVLILAEGPAGYAALGPHDQRGAAAGGEGRARSCRSRSWPRSRRRVRGGSPPRGVARASCPRRSCATVPRPRSARSSS